MTKYYYETNHSADPRSFMADSDEDAIIKAKKQQAIVLYIENEIGDFREISLEK
jgi:hypothetical protein